MKSLILLITIFLAFNSVIYTQVSINNDNSAPNGSSMLDVKSTDKGFHPPMMTTAQRNAIPAPAEGLVIYNTDQKSLNVYNGTAWKTVKPVPDFVCGLAINVNHVVSGSVAPVNKSVVYGTVTGIPGEPSKCWITSNLGSDHQAASSGDDSEASAGWYWQFNTKQGFKHDGTTRTPNTIWITLIGGTSGWISSNDPCSIELGNQWRIPTYSEWNNVLSAGGWITYTDPWNSGLKLHLAGALDQSTGFLINRGSAGRYWSSSSNGTKYSAWEFNISNTCYMYLDLKEFGYSIRCVRPN